MSTAVSDPVAKRPRLDVRPSTQPHEEEEEEEKQSSDDEEEEEDSEEEDNDEDDDESDEEMISEGLKDFYVRTRARIMDTLKRSAFEFHILLDLYPEQMAILSVLKCDHYEPFDLTIVGEAQQNGHGTITEWKLKFTRKPDIFHLQQSRETP